MNLTLYFDSSTGHLMFSEVTAHSATRSDVVDDILDIYTPVVIEQTDAPDIMVNAVLNDPEHITLNGTTVVYTGASGDVRCRYVPPSDWKMRTKPALMRAAHASSFFNI